MMKRMVLLLGGVFSATLGLAAAFHHLLPADEQAISSAARDFLTGIVPVGTGIQVKPLSPTLVVPTCDHYQGFLYHVPPKGRYATVEVRCLSPQSWSVYVSATLSRYVDVFVARHDLSAGHRVVSSDIHKQHIPLTDEQHYIVRSTMLLGFDTNRSILAGHRFVLEDVRLPLVIRAHHTVSVYVAGRGFQARAKGMALNDAFPGQSVRVRIRSEVLEGEATEDGAVRLSF